MRSTAHRNPTGFTLIELLVACFILGTGVLALASTSVAVARLTGDAARAGLAAERSQARLESLRSAPCAVSSGTLLAGGVSEWWSAVPSPAGQALRDSVQYPAGTRHDMHSDLLESAAWCS